MSDICVFCGSSSGSDPAFRDAAVELGLLIASGGHRLVYGGGDVGLMGLVADSTLEHGGEVTGVMTEQLLTEEVAHPRLTRLEVAASMHERKAIMAALSDGVIALPGGFGTYEEAFEILTWNQLGLVNKPVVFCDVKGFYAPLFDMIEHTADSGFLHDGHRAIAQRASTPTAALALALAPAPAFFRKWVD